MSRSVVRFIALMAVIFSDVSAQQRIYGIMRWGELYWINMDNCSIIKKGQTWGHFLDIAFTPDGRLWANYGTDLFEMDTANATPTWAAQIPLSSALAAWDDSTLLVESGRKLYKISTTNFQVSLIDTIGYKTVGDMVRYDNALYLTGWNTTNTLLPAQLTKVDLNNNLTATLSVTQIGNHGHSSMGLATASVSGHINQILSFELNLSQSADLRMICPIDGSYFTICPGLLNYEPWGMASVTLPVQSPDPTSCLDTVVVIDTMIFTAVKTEQLSRRTLVVGPNPFSETLRLIFSSDLDPKLFSAIVIDNLGNKVYENRDLQGSVLDLGSLSPGSYFLILKSGILNKKIKVFKE